MGLGRRVSPEDGRESSGGRLASSALRELRGDVEALLGRDSASEELPSFAAVAGRRGACLRRLPEGGRTPEPRAVCVSGEDAEDAEDGAAEAEGEAETEEEEAAAAAEAMAMRDPACGEGGGRERRRERRSERETSRGEERDRGGVKERKKV